MRIDVFVHMNSSDALSDLGDKVTTLFTQQEQLMSQITQWAASQQADLDTISATLDGITAGIAALDKLIVDFQNSPGTMSPADQAALDAIQTSSHALAVKATAIVVTPPPTPLPAA